MHFVALEKRIPSVPRCERARLPAPSLRPGQLAVVPHPHRPAGGPPAIKEIAAVEAEWRQRLAREGLQGNIVAALTHALAT